MNDCDCEYRQLRDTWNDYNHRQEFEHTLIDRKTTWLLSTQAILFAAYGVTFDSETPAAGVREFRVVVACTGALVAAIVVYGVVFLIKSKRLSWTKYCGFFAPPDPHELPRPFEGEPLQWGVDTRNTERTLLPDRALPVVLVVAWCVLLVVELLRS